MSVYAHLIWAGICVLALVVGALYERHEGAAASIARDTAAETKIEVKDAAAEATATAETQKEMSDYAQATSQPVTTAPVVRVCAPAKPSGAGKVLPAAPAAGATDAGADVPGAAQPDSVGSDIGEPIEEIGRKADAQVAGLIDYVTKVCPPPP